MPIIKTKRDDILRRQEVLEMLSQAEDWLACLIAFSWIFGKRINEVLKVKKQDVWTDQDFLYTRFHVSKKKTRVSPGLPKPFLKRINLKHEGVAYIISYCRKVKDGNLFPKMSRQLAYYYLKKLNSKVWWHLFRESLATLMAEKGATEEQLMHWFDWDRVDTAHQYVKRGTKLTEELSQRMW